MAKRNVFVSDLNSDNLVRDEMVEFQWYPGFAKSQKQKSIASLHENFKKENKELKVLEISTSSTEKLGILLSAFNLRIIDKNNRDRGSVESVFQSSKKFENGGPYKDIQSKSSIEAKKDIRLKNSGKLVCFVYKDEEWGLEPKTHFYDWIYMNTLHLNKQLAEEIIKYDAFTDIEFNPQKSINCQARSAALYVSLYRSNQLEKVLSSKSEYLKFINRDNDEQLSLL